MQEDKKEQFSAVMSNLIKNRREKLNKNIYLISAESFIPRSTWRDIEVGLRKDINLTTFCKIAEGLDMKPYELLRELCENLGDDFSFTDLGS